MDLNNDFSFYFKSFFPNLETFSEYLANENYFAPTYEEDNITDYIFKVLFREYHNTPVLYYTKEDFLCDFANVFDNIYDKIKREIELLNKIYELTDSELVSVSKVVTSSNQLTNNAINPAEEITETDQPLKYIDDQTHDMLQSESEQTRNKLKAYIEALDNVPVLRAKYIIKAFRKLFNNIYNRDLWVYKGE